MPVASMPRPRLLPRSSVLAICLLGVGSFSLPLGALPARHAHKEAKEEIQDLEERWRTATLAGDAASIDSMLADDFVGISWNGQVNTKSSQLDRVRTRTLAISGMQISDTHIKLLGQVAIVTAEAQIRGMNENVPMEGNFRYTRIYQHLPSGWKITNFEATRLPRNQHAHLAP